MVCGQVEAEVLGRVLGIGEQDRPVVGVDHPAVVRRHVLLELGLVEVAGLLAERLGDLVVDDVHPADRVDPDHRRQRRHGHVVLVTHHLGDDRADLVVHQREAAPVGRGAVGLERALVDCLERGHCANSFGSSRPSEARMPLNRLLTRSRPSSNRGGFASGCDHSGCSVRAALERARGPVRQPVLHDRLVVVGELAVVGEQLEHRRRVAQVALGEVVLGRADHRRGDEVAVARSGLLDQLAAEQLADERLEHDVRGEDRLAPVVDRGQPLGDVAHALPGRVGRSRSPGARCRRSRRSPRTGSGCTARGPARRGSGACCSPRSRCCACSSARGGSRSRTGRGRGRGRRASRRRRGARRSGPSCGSTARRPSTAGRPRRSG